jgi:hypothetical protein
MTVIDDITALLTPVLHTNTTKDITAAAVRTALISAFTDVVNAEMTPTQISGIAQQIARHTLPRVENMTGIRAAQDVVGIAPASSCKGLQPAANRAIGGAGMALDKMISDVSGAPFDQPGWVATDFMAVEPGGKVTASLQTNSGIGLTFYDASKSFISTVHGPLADGQVVTVPANAFYVRQAASYDGNATNASGGIHNLQVLDGDRSADFPHPWQGMPAYVSQFRPWTNRVISTHGDSMGANRTGNHWYREAAQYHGFRYLKNQAIDGGDTQKLMGIYNEIGNAQVPMPTGYFADVDLCVVIVGTNDAAIGRSIGAITDDPATATTFYGYYRKFIEFALTDNPYMRMILATPLYSDSPGKTNAIMNSYMDAVRALCAKYAIKLWDIGHESQFCDLTYAFYSDDDLHPRYHATNPDPLVSPWIPKELGSSLVFGSQFRALLHTVFPIDFKGDPTWRESGTTYTRPSI